MPPLALLPLLITAGVMALVLLWLSDTAQEFILLCLELFLS